MEWLALNFRSIESIIDSGGPVIYVILVVAFLLWLLILERYWFLFREHPKNLDYGLEIWIENHSIETISSSVPLKEQSNKTSSWYAQKVKNEIISILSLALHSHIRSIKTLIAICPLLGLLGTVIGMIEVFDVLAITGTGNARAMADSISRATIPTMAGMVVALSALYFSYDIERRSNTEAFRLKEDFQS